MPPYFRVTQWIWAVAKYLIERGARLGGSLDVLYMLYTRYARAADYVESVYVLYHSLAKGSDAAATTSAAIELYYKCVCAR